MDVAQDLLILAVCGNAGASVFLGIGVLRGTVWLERGRGVGTVAFALLGASILVGVLSARAPWAPSLPDWVLLFVFVGGLFYHLYARHRELALVGAFVQPLTVVLLLPVLVLPQAALRAPLHWEVFWFWIHVGSMVAAYAAYAMAAGTATAYLWAFGELRKKRAGRLRMRRPALELLERLTWRMVLVGTVTYAVGLVFGSLGASADWGRHWIDHPQVWVGFVVLIPYVLFLFNRLRRPFSRMGSRLCLAGFALALVELWGVGLLRPGPHRFLG